MPDDAAVSAEIVEAARKYFLRFGYNRVSTDEIARSIGRSKKTLYQHFPSKEALLHAVLARVDAEAQAGIERELRERAGSGAERLRRILTAVGIHVAATHQVLFADLRADDPRLATQLWAERRAALLAMLGMAVRDAAGDGSLRRDLPAEQVLEAFLACLEGMTARMELALDPQDPGKTFAGLVSLLIDGIKAR